MRRGRFTPRSAADKLPAGDVVKMQAAVSEYGISGVVGNSQADASGNLSALQQALSNGLMSLTAASDTTIWINGTLLVPDNATVEIGPRVRIKQAAGTNLPLLMSDSISAAGTTVTLSWSSGLDCTVAWPSHGRSVGQFVWLAGATQSQYRGVFKVKTVTDANTIVVRLWRTPTTTPTGTITARVPNIGQRFRIDGTLDYNNSENDSATGINTFAMLVAGVRPVIDGARFTDVKKYCLCLGAVIHARVNDIHAENTNSDIVKVYGPAWDVEIDGITGSCHDDALSFQPKEPIAYAQYDWTNGDVINCVGQNIHIQSTTTSPVVLYATANEFMTDVTIDGVSCLESANILARIESGAGLTGTVMGVINVRNLRRSEIASAQTQLKVTQNGTIQQLNVQGLDFDGTTANVTQFETGSTSTIDELNIVEMSGTTAISAYAILLGGAIKTLNATRNKVKGASVNTGRFLQYNGAACQRINVFGNDFESLDKAVDIGSGAVAGIVVSLRDNSFKDCFCGAQINKAGTVQLSGNRGNFGSNGLVRATAGVTVDVYSDGTNVVTGSWITRAGSEVLKVRGSDIRMDVTTLARFDGGIVYNTNAAAGTLAAAGLVSCQGSASNSWRLLGDPTKQY